MPSVIVHRLECSQTRATTLMPFDPSLEELVLQKVRIIWSPNIHPEAILFPEKCQSSNSQDVIVLSLFTEQPLTALHSNSIFKFIVLEKKIL